MSTRHLVLDVELDTDPITGRLHEVDGSPERDFSGYIELIAALEALSVEAGARANKEEEQ